MMDNSNNMETEEVSYTLKGASETLLPLQLFEFKTHLLEAVEELRMSRKANIQYEEQISKILMEKQELTWKTESLSNQEEMLEKRHKDALDHLKKQLQAKMCTMEEEKGRFQLAAETKEREIIGLREEMKTLQFTKYSLEKKVHELEQKLQLHILAREDHMKQLSECEKCFGNVTQQFGMIKEVHEKLEQSVQIAIQKNKMLKAEIKQKDNEIHRLKEELQNLSSDLIRYKVDNEGRNGQNKISLFEREHQLKELRERLQMERDLNKRLLEDNATLKEKKQEDVKALTSMASLLQRHTQTIVSLEKHLSAVKEEFKILERDNELQRANATENEEKFLVLQSEQEKALNMWKEREQRMSSEHENIKKELELVKEAFEKLHKLNSYDAEATKPDKDHEQKKEQERGLGSCEDSMNIDQAGNATNLNPECCSTPEVQLKEVNGCGSDSVCQDMIRLPNIYNITDKTNLSEEQRSSSKLPENKAEFVAAEANLEQLCESKPTEAMEADRPGLRDADEDGESAAKCRSALQTPAIMESVKLLPDNNKPATVCSQNNAIQQTVCSHRKSGDGTSEVVYTVIDKTDTAENNQGVLKNETHTKESQLLPHMVKQIINTADIEKPETANSNGYAAIESKDYTFLESGTPDLSAGSSPDKNKKSVSDSVLITKETSRLCKEFSVCNQTVEEKLLFQGNVEPERKSQCTKMVEMEVNNTDQGQISSVVNPDSEVTVKMMDPHNPQERQDSPKVSSDSGETTQGSANWKLAFDNLNLSIHPAPRKDHSIEWNAAAQRFHNAPFPTEHGDKMDTGNGCPDVSPATSTTTTITPNSSSGLQVSQHKPQPEKRPVEVEDCSSIQHQINAIEKFLLHHRLNEPRKRKPDSCIPTKEP